MKPIIIGVISKNLCVKKASSSSSINPSKLLYRGGGKYDDTEFFGKFNGYKTHTTKTLREQNDKKVHLERAILIDGEMTICLGLKESAEIIKTSLLKVYLKEAKDFEIASGIRIPQGFVDKIYFPFKTHPVTLNILPILSFGIDTSSVSVPWSIYSPNNNNNNSDQQQQQQHVIEAPESMNYVDFLLCYAAKHQTRIDYSIFIYSKPLIFGQATLVYKTNGSNNSTSNFFFARILSCKDLIEHKLLANIITNTTKIGFKSRPS